jgi:hypothetical protein
MKKDKVVVMRDIAIFTPEVAEALINKGFSVVTQTKKAWYFEDSIEIRIVIEEILENFENTY